MRASSARFHAAATSCRRSRSVGRARSELRLLLEPVAARQAAGRVDQDSLRKLDAFCRAGYEPGNRESEAAFLRANRQFHVAIAQTAGNKRLAGVLAQLLEEMERLLHLGLAVRNRSGEMQHEHKSLVEALASGDADAAERTTVEQIEAARRMVMDGIMSASWLKDTPVGQWYPPRGDAARVARAASSTSGLARLPRGASASDRSQPADLK